MQTNNYIRTLYPTGKYLPSAKYTHKQCGEYLNDNFLASRQISSSYESKKKLVEKFGFLTGKGMPKVGDIAVMDYGTAAGHILIVNTTDFVDGKPKRICFTDCNLIKVGTVNNDFWVVEGDKNWKRIYGFARLALNEKTEAAQPKVEIPAWAKDAVEWTKEKGYITDWSDPYLVVGNETLEFSIEKLGHFDPKKHEGKVTLLRWACALYGAYSLIFYL